VDVGGSDASPSRSVEMNGWTRPVLDFLDSCLRFRSESRIASSLLADTTCPTHGLPVRGFDSSTMRWSPRGTLSRRSGVSEPHDGGSTGLGHRPCEFRSIASLGCTCSCVHSTSGNLCCLRTRSDPPGRVRFPPIRVEREPPRSTQERPGSNPFVGWGER